MGAEERPPDGSAGRSLLAADHGCGDLLCDDLDGVTRRLKASKIRQDAAVLGDLAERDAM
jgi:hypothetical protein